MIKKLFESGCFDYKKFILNNLKPLAISSDEAVILIKLLDDYEPDMVTNNNRFKDSTITKSRLDKALVSLMERGFYDIYVKNGVEMVSLDKFFTKVELILNNKPVDFESEISKVIDYVSEQISRMLSSKENEIIQSLVLEDRKTLDAFKRSVAYLTKNNKKITFKSITDSLSVNDDLKESDNSPNMMKSFFSSIL